jgi:hypothetical protein
MNTILLRNPPRCESCKVHHSYSNHRLTHSPPPIHSLPYLNPISAASFRSFCHQPTRGKEREKEIVVSLLLFNIENNSIMAGLGRRTHYRKHLTDSVLHDLPEPDDDERIAKVVSTRGSNQFDIIVSVSSSAASAELVGSSSGGIGSLTNCNSKCVGPQRTPQLAILPTKFHKLVWVKRNDYVIVQTGTVEQAEEQQEPQEDNNRNNNNNNNHPNYDNTAEDHSDVQIDRVNMGKNSNNNNNNENVHNNDDADNDKDAASTAPTVAREVDHHDGGIRYIITHILYKDQVKHLKGKGLWPVGDPEFDDHEVLGQQQQNQSTIDHEGVSGAEVVEDVDDDGIVYDDYDDENDDDLFVNTNRIARLEIQDSDDEASSDEES